MDNEINIKDLYKDYIERFDAIPFGNSQVQNRALVAADEFSPARKYRALGLRLRDRLASIMHLYFAKKRELLETEQLIQSLEKEEDEISRQLIELDLEEKRFQTLDTAKLLKDCLIEVEGLFAEIQLYPKFTRKEFELQEQEHFKLKCKLEIPISFNPIDESNIDMNKIPELVSSYKQMLE